ncbi:MAG: SpoIIE family protein phosphatase [Chitinispirillaceae bacterium]|jgi:sigma-B regulation protein RsbU (phosphoserine phosphatase)|nr:SpoIIE family protein phosphatase [Chitinispirillaceae bacterium]
MNLQTSFRSSLQTRLIVNFIAIISMLMLATTYVGIRRESNAIMRQMEKDGVALAMAYGTSIENSILLGSAGLNRLTSVAGRSRGINYLMITDSTATVIAHTNFSMIGEKITDDVLLRQTLETPISAFEKVKKPTTTKGKDPSGKSVFKVAIPLVTLGSIMGALEIELDTSGISEAIDRANRQSLLIALIAILLGGFYAWFFSMSLTRPVKMLVAAAGAVSSGDLTPTISVKGRDEIAHLSASFNHMTEKLREYTRNLTQQSRLQGELDAARRIQYQCTPHSVPNIPRIKVSSAYYPANEVGGDYLDYFKTDDGNWVVVIADVCGKGLPAALFMIMLRSAVRVLGRKASTARELLIAVNEAVAPDLNEKAFITALCLIINKDGTSMSYARAGHPMLLRIPGRGRQPEQIKTSGVALGILTDPVLFAQALTEETVVLEKGNFFLIYTDGLTEATNPASQIYEADRVKKSIMSSTASDPESMLNAIIEGLKAFTQGGPAHDDLTMLVMQVET